MDFAQKNANGDNPTSGAVVLRLNHVMKMRAIATLMLNVSEAWSVENVTGGLLYTLVQDVAQNVPTCVLLAGYRFLEIKCVTDVLPMLSLGKNQKAPVRKPFLEVD